MTGAVATPADTRVSTEGELVVLDNGIVRAAIDRSGHVVSLIDHADGREAISSDEPGNRLRLHRDEPANWDAWDIDEYYRRTVIELDDVDIVHRRGQRGRHRASYAGRVDHPAADRAWPPGHTPSSWTHEIDGTSSRSC